MWQTPVYDRTAADVAAGAEKCYITAELLNRIEGNTAHMAQLLGVEIDTRTWTSLGLLTRAQMQRILDNLATVRAAYYTLPGTPNIPTAPSTLYSAINDMEQVLWSLHELWQRNSVKQYAGSIVDRGNWSAQIVPGGKVTIPPGRHAGDGSVSAAALKTMALRVSDWPHEYPGMEWHYTLTGGTLVGVAGLGRASGDASSNVIESIRIAGNTIYVKNASGGYPMRDITLLYY